MNTAQLQADYPEVYEEFFGKYDMVISSPIVCSLTHLEYWNGNWNKTAISSKIPLRNYVWINFDKRFKWIQFIKKENQDDGFSSDNFITSYPVDINCFERVWLHYDIWCLSEYNWTDEDSYIACFLTVLLLANKQIEPHDLNNLHIERENSELLTLYLDYDKSLIENKKFFSNIRNSNFNLWFSLLWANWHLLGIQNIGKVSYLYPREDKSYDHLDLAHHIINPKIKLRWFKSWYLNRISNEINELQENFWIKYNLSYTDAFEIIERLKSFQVIPFLKSLYSSDEGWYKIFEQLESLNNIRYAIEPSRLNHQINTNWIFDYIKKNKITYEPFCIYHAWQRIRLYSPKKYDLSFSDLDEINRLFNTMYSLDYSSNIDWRERYWVRLEQRNSKGIFSKYSNKKIAIEFSHSWINFIPEKEININKYQWIVLDQINNKIYIGWNHLSSKDLPTQKGTIEIFSFFLKNHKKTLQNKDLPVSSYSKNKNTLKWKIIIPLQKLLEREWLEPLTIKTDWSLFEFQFKILPSNTPICLICHR